ncbi:MAG: tryptophan-rich sensory protein [Candidatus Poseidoniales archaeon]|nr:MAG: tryptophan-rich sensory protein [Candidatus Poseidoniales archaeon]
MTFDSEYEPFFQPPGWIIGPIWTILYTSIAISFYITLSRRSELEYRYPIIVLFITQLALNLAWSDVFNSANYLLSLTMLVFMIIFTIIYAYLIYKPIKLASIIVWPYIAWITFAAVINTAYYIEFN